MTLEQRISIFIKWYNRSCRCRLLPIEEWKYIESPSSISYSNYPEFRAVDNLIRENLALALLSPIEYIRMAAEYFIKESK
jgi:hypothetical protein